MTQEINIPGYDTLNRRSAQLFIKMLLEEWDVKARVEIEKCGQIVCYPDGRDSTYHLVVLMADAGFLALDGEPEFGDPVKKVVNLNNREAFLALLVTRDN